MSTRSERHRRSASPLGQGVRVGGVAYDLDRDAASRLLDLVARREDTLVEERSLVAVGADRFRRVHVLAAKFAGG